MLLLLLPSRGWCFGKGRSLWCRITAVPSTQWGAAEGTAAGARCNLGLLAGQDGFGEEAAVAVCAQSWISEADVPCMGQLLGILRPRQPEPHSVTALTPPLQAAPSPIVSQS